MKTIIYNNTKLRVSSVLPSPGFIAMMIFGSIFYRKEYEDLLSNELYEDTIMNIINHENIHKEQIKDFGLPFFWCKPLQLAFGGLLFYLIYFIEWFFRLFFNGRKAYKNISFEKEAYANEANQEYIKIRRHFSQWF